MNICTTNFFPYIPEKLNDVIVKPITVMSVDELERLLPCMGAALITWPELLNERFDRSRRYSDTAVCCVPNSYSVPADHGSNLL